MNAVRSVKIFKGFYIGNSESFEKANFCTVRRILFAHDYLIYLCYQQNNCKMESTVLTLNIGTDKHRPRSNDAERSMSTLLDTHPDILDPSTGSTVIFFFNFMTSKVRT